MQGTWAVPENRALARRQHLLGLHRGYAALLITVVLQLAVSMRLVIPAAYVLVVGWGSGALLTAYDGHAWEVIVSNLKVARVLRST